MHRKNVIFVAAASALFGVAFGLVFSSCGVKGPPLPPEQAMTPQQSDKNGWSPGRGSPRPSPSPSS